MGARLGTHYYLFIFASTIDTAVKDFNMTVRKVFFPAGSRASKGVSFPIFDDTIDEEPEGFIIVLYRDDNLTSIEVAFTPNLRTTLGRINDDDRELYTIPLSFLYLTLPFS